MHARQVTQPRSRARTGLVFAVSVAAVLSTATVSLAGIKREQERFEGSAARARPLSLGSTETLDSAHGALPAVVAAVRAARRGASIPSGLRPPLDELRDWAPSTRRRTSAFRTTAVQ